MQGGLLQVGRQAREVEETVSGAAGRSGGQASGTGRVQGGLLQVGRQARGQARNSEHCVGVLQAGQRGRPVGQAAAAQWGASKAD